MKVKYGSYKYIYETSLNLLNRIINESEDLTPEQLKNEKFLIKGELYNEIFNFLNNHSNLGELKDKLKVTG